MACHFPTENYKDFAERRELGCMAKKSAALGKASSCFPILEISKEPRWVI